MMARLGALVQVAGSIDPPGCVSSVVSRSIGQHVNICYHCLDALNVGIKFVASDAAAT